jgi:hypothetical protein
MMIYWVRTRRRVSALSWCSVGELPYGIGNPAPGHRAVVIAVGRKLVNTRGALLKRLLAIAFEHQVGGSPNIDLSITRRKVHAYGQNRLTSSCTTNLPVGTFEFANSIRSFSYTRPATWLRCNV